LGVAQATPPGPLDPRLDWRDEARARPMGRDRATRAGAAAARYTEFLELLFGDEIQRRANREHAWVYLTRDTTEFDIR
jgi:hypothetical protein